MGDPWVCIGHSHVAALALAGDKDLDAMNFWETGEPWVRRGDGATDLRTDLAERVARGRIVLSLIGGSAHTVLGMVEHPRRFDLVLPSDPDLPLDDDRELVPAEAVRATLFEMSDPYADNIPALSRATAAPVLHLAPPPPVADPDRIAPHVPWGMFTGQPRQVAPKWLRYKLWRLHCEVIEATCARLGVRYVPAPKSAQDDEGFLHPAYDRDGAHANAAYGALVLAELRQSL